MPRVSFPTMPFAAARAITRWYAAFRSSSWCWSSSLPFTVAARDDGSTMPLIGAGERAETRHFVLPYGHLREPNRAMLRHQTERANFPARPRGGCRFDHS